jgi:multiple sugar transport system substrate-binding protein
VEIDPDLAAEESIDMNRSRSSPRILALLGIVAILAAACGNASSSTSPSASAAASAAPSATPAGTPEPTPIVTPPPVITGPGPNGGVVVRWFIGLGAGTQPAQIGPEQAFITAYNASQKDVYIQYEIVDNTQAATILKTEIAAGNAPDIIGPVGVEGLNLFADQLLDLKPQIASTGYEPTGVDPALVEFFNSLGQNGATVGLPFAVYPSFIFYNQDLFEEAGLPLPPTKVGDLYDGKPWDLDALRTLAMKLTVDKNGKDATDPAFDAANIEQWGFESQYMDNYNLRAESAWFGTGDLLGADGKAVIPAPMAQGAKWYNDGVWKDHFIPTASQVASALLAGGNEFGSGNIAINEGHTWFTCCVNPPEGKKAFKFGFAVQPTINGTTTSPLHADTFSILKTTKVPDAAFKALTAMVASTELLTAYGAMPADSTKQQAWFDSIDANFPSLKLNWDVAKAMLAYPDIPNHQSFVPDYASMRSAMQAFGNAYRTTDGLDMDAELAKLQTTLQGIFDAAATP